MYCDFVDSEKNPIYVHINGSCNGLMEVVFKNENWDHAQRVEKIFHAIVIPFMTQGSIKNAFMNGAQYANCPTDSVLWNPPILTTNTNPASTMNEVFHPPLSKKLRHVEFSYTTNSEVKYRSSDLAGTRKVDIPSTIQLMTYAETLANHSHHTIQHHESVVSTMSESEILKKFQIYEDELIALKIQVYTLVQQHTDMNNQVSRYQSDIIEKHQANQKSMTKFRRKTNSKIKSSNDELKLCIEKISRKETKNTNKTQNMLRLLLQERAINLNHDDDDALDESDDDEYIPDAMDDPDDQYDSEDLDAFFEDDDDDLPDYDNTLPYITPNLDSSWVASPGVLTNSNIIHQNSRTRSQSKSQSQGVAATQ